MQAFSDVVRDCMDARYPGIPGSNSDTVLRARDKLYNEFGKKRAAGEPPEKDLSKPNVSSIKKEPGEEGETTLSPFIGKTIAEVIDLTDDGGDEIVIRVKKNATLHDALTSEEHEYLQTFGKDDEEEEETASEHSVESEEDFMTKEAVQLLRDLSLHESKGSELKAKAADLIEGGTLPPEACEEVYSQAVRSGQKSTPVSEALYDECESEAEFHLILALGWRTYKEAAAARDFEAGRAPRAVPSFMKLSKEFQVACGTVSRQYNEAVRYAMQRKAKTSSKNQ